MKQGDLVIHNTSPDPITPERKLVGIVIKKDKKYHDFFKIFWYTTGQIQSIHLGCLDLYKEEDDT